MVAFWYGISEHHWRKDSLYRDDQLQYLNILTLKTSQNMLNLIYTSTFNNKMFTFVHKKDFEKKYFVWLQLIFTIQS